MSACGFDELGIRSPDCASMGDNDALVQELQIIEALHDVVQADRTMADDSFDALVLDLRKECLDHRRWKEEKVESENLVSHGLRRTVPCLLGRRRSA